MTTKILSTGIGLPENEIKNEELSNIVRNFDSAIAKSTLDQWIQNHYGIKRRRWLTDIALPSELAYTACLQALKRASVNIKEVDFLILNTVYGDFTQPTTATTVQKLLGMKPGSFAFEINMPCSGPIFSLVTAHQFLLSGRYKHGLIVGVDKMSSCIDKKDFIMAGLFGDGAGACLLAPSTKGIIDYYLSSSGEDYNDMALSIPGGRSMHPEPSKEFPIQLLMNGKKVEHFIDTCFHDIQVNLLNKSDKQIDFVVPHQASLKAIEKNALKIGIAKEKIISTIEDYGNTSSASIFITLDKLLNSFDIQEKTIFLAGMGGGLNWGGLLYSH